MEPCRELARKSRALAGALAHARDRSPLLFHRVSQSDCASLCGGMGMHTWSDERELLRVNPETLTRFSRDRRHNRNFRQPLPGRRYIFDRVG